MQLDELYHLQGFQITDIADSSSGQVLIKANSVSTSAICPYCQTRSLKRHSAYIRKPQVLPCSDTPIQIILSVQRYCCPNSGCSHKTFAERISSTVRFYARRTKALETLLTYVAFEMSAETASRVCQKAQIPISPDSILRLVRKTKVDQDVLVRVLGVDDWAFRKGQNYGTILIDLERNQTIELLPDRTQHTLSAWLLKHPEIESSVATDPLNTKRGSIVVHPKPHR